MSGIRLTLVLQGRVTGIRLIVVLRGGVTGIRLIVVLRGGVTGICLIVVLRGGVTGISVQTVFVEQSNRIPWGQSRLLTKNEPYFVFSLKNSSR